MKKTFVSMIVFTLVAVLFVAIVYYKLSLQKVNQNCQKRTLELNQKILTLENQSSKQQQNDEIIKNWKTYTNNEHGFSFAYPNEWEDTERKIEIQDYFVLENNSEASIFNIEIIDSKDELKSIAEDELQRRNCPADKIIEDHKINGVIYVTECGASSEVYSYIFKNNNGEVIKLAYHDDFESGQSMDKKLEKFLLIIDSISLF